RAAGLTPFAPERRRRLSSGKLVNRGGLVEMRRLGQPVAGVTRCGLVGGTLRRMHQLTTHGGNRLRRGARLDRQLLTEILDVEIGMPVFAEREADIGCR